MLQKSRLQVVWFFCYRCPDKKSVSNQSITLYICYIYNVGALLGHNLTDTVDITNQYDHYVTNSTLKDLTRYVSFF